MPQAIERVHHWLVSADSRRRALEPFFDELAQQFVGAGLPLWKMRCTVLAMHPDVFGRVLQWTREGGVHTDVATVHTLKSDDYVNSPVQALHAGAARVRQRLERGEVDHPQLAPLRAAGGTDYLALALNFGSGRRSYVSIVTDAPGGFDDAHLAAFEQLLPALETRLELESTRFSMGTLLEVYLGPNAARRIAAGDFKRGTGQRIRAAIWLCDLRGFTALTDRLPVQEVVPVLDAYFEAMAGPLAEGGEILKFIGDSILAVFPVVTDEASAARRAVQAAADSIEAFARASPALTHGLKVGVSVNLGEVMYGNIGARERLDFTVIGPAVNEAARMEALCKPLQVPLVLSETVARHLEQGERHGLGSHPLRGVSGERALFTLPRFAPASAPPGGAPPPPRQPTGS